MGVVGGQSRLLAVVAVGEMLGAAGTVGVDGGGWEGRIVGCLFIVDDNKSSVRVCRRSLWAYRRNNKYYRAYIIIFKWLHSAAEGVLSWLIT